MDFFTFMKDFFTFPQHSRDQRDQFPYDRSQFFNDRSDEFNDRNSHFSNGDDESRGFNIFTDPLEMHRYFEQQMNEMLRMFGMHDGSRSSSFDMFRMPAIGDIGEESTPPPTESGSLRDHFLKHGYDKPATSTDNTKTDSDLDGKLDIADLDTVLKEPNSRSSQTPKIQFFGQSISTSTVHKPDGTVETHRTIRNHDGTEETTITKKQGDKEYTIIKKRDRDGREEITENIVNMEEGVAKNFLKDKMENNEIDPNQSRHNWFDWNKLFK